MGKKIVASSPAKAKGESVKKAAFQSESKPPARIIPIEKLVGRARRKTEQDEHPSLRSSRSMAMAGRTRRSASKLQEWDDPDLASPAEPGAVELQEDMEVDDQLLSEMIDPSDPVSLYFREVSKVPLLTHEEEIALAKRIEAGQEASSMLVQSSRTPKDKLELQRLVEDGWAAREHLITANFRLVISVAKKYIGRGLPFLDLIQDGNIGLIRATKKFDFRRGYRFSTYATWWIRQAVSRAVADHGRTIRLPVHLGDQINRMHRLNHRLTQKLGREPSPSELAKALDMPMERVEELLSVDQRPLSLEFPTDEEDDNDLADFTPDRIQPAPADMVHEKIMQEHIRAVLNTIPAREAHILQLRYGLLDGKSHTLGEVGRKLGVTRERVRQIEAQAFRRLRQPKLKQLLQDYLRG